MTSSIYGEGWSESKPRPFTEFTPSRLANNGISKKQMASAKLTKNSTTLRVLDPERGSALRKTQGYQVSAVWIHLLPKLGILRPLLGSFALAAEKSVLGNALPITDVTYVNYINICIYMHTYKQF